MPKVNIFEGNFLMRRHKLGKILENKVHQKKWFKKKLLLWVLTLIHDFSMNFSFGNNERIFVKMWKIKVSGVISILKKQKIPFGMFYFAIILSELWILQVETLQPNWHYSMYSQFSILSPLLQNDDYPFCTLWHQCIIKRGFY